MRHYEAMYIVDAELTDEQLEPILAKYKKVVSDMGAVVGDAGKWEHGRRRLAYEIDKKRDGIYVLMRFQSGAEVPLELERVFRISDDVFRYLVVRSEPAAIVPESAVVAAEPVSLPVSSSDTSAEALPSPEAGEVEVDEQQAVEPDSSEPPAELAEPPTAETEIPPAEIDGDQPAVTLEPEHVAASGAQPLPVGG